MRPERGWGRSPEAKALGRGRTGGVAGAEKAGRAAPGLREGSVKDRAGRGWKGERRGRKGQMVSSCPRRWFGRGAGDVPWSCRGHGMGASRAGGFILLFAEDAGAILGLCSFPWEFRQLRQSGGPPRRCA